MPGQSYRRVEIPVGADIRAFEAAMVRAGVIARDTGNTIGDQFTKGTDKAAGGVHKLSALGASWGLPFMGSLDKIGSKLDEAHTKTGKFSTAMAEAGKVTLAAGTLGFAWAAAEAAKLGATFQTTTASIQANAGISAAAAKAMGGAFLDTAGKSTFSGQQMAAAYASVAGQLRLTEGRALSTAQGLRVMKAATDLAEASQTDLGTATQALVSVMQAYHQGVGQAASTSNVLFNTAKSLGVPIDQVATAVSRLHGRLGSLAPSLTDVATLMAEMAQHGITGSRGVMTVNTALQTLVGGTKKTDDVLRALGVSLFDSRGHFIGLQAVISQLQPKLAGLTDQQRLYVAQTLFGKSAGQAMMQVIQSGPGAYQKATDAVAKHNAVQQAATVQSHTLHGELEILKSTVIDLGTKFGLWLIPKLQAVGSAVASVIGWFQKHTAAAVALAAVIGGVLSVAVAAFAYQKAVAFVGAVQNMTSGIASLLVKLGLLPAVEAEVATATEALTVAEGASATAADGLAASNAALGASFTAMAGPIGLAAAALGGFGYALANTNPGAAPPQGTLYANPRGGIVWNGGSGKLGFLGGLGKTLGGLGNALPHMQQEPGNFSMPTVGSAWQRIAGALAGQDFSKVAIAGILGNFAQETGGGNLNAINTRDSGTGASGMGGMGIAQWTLGRRQNEMIWAAIHHLSPTSLVAQVGYLLNELRHQYHNAFKAIQNAASPAAAAEMFNKLFEGGSDPNGVRERSAAQAFALLGGVTHGRGSAGGAGGGNAAIQHLLSLLGLGKSAGSHARSRAIRTLLYADPLHGDTYTVSRTDQGKDYANIHGMIGAVGAGVVTLAQSLQGFGQTIVEKLTSGPNKGKEIYYGLETGASGVGLHVGQHVSAGQAVARGAGSGVIEMGFWNPATGRSMGAPFFNGSNATPPGTAFANWMAQLSRSGGTFLTTRGGTTTGGGANLGYTIAHAVQVFVDGLKKAGNALITVYQNLEQSGTARTLSKALGLSTAGKESEQLHRIIQHLGPNASIGQIDTGLQRTLNRGVAGSGAEKGFESTVAALLSAGQVRLARELVSAHRAAMATLAQEMYAEQVTKDGELLNLQATELRDQNQLQQNYFNQLLTVARAQEQQTVDLMQEQVTAIRNMTQGIQDRFAEMVQAIQDSTQAAADASAAVVAGINDNTQIQVDIMGERGLFGLNLIAQKLQVNADEVKAYWDQQIALSQQNLDSVTAHWHTAVANAQLFVDLVQTTEDQLVAQAQQHMDTVIVAQQIGLTRAQSKLDAVTAHEDAAVIGPAQIAVDLGATLPKAQQDVLNAQLRRAEGKAGVAEGRAQSRFNATAYTASQAIIAAQGQFDAVQGQANRAIAAAQGYLAEIQGQANAAIANAQNALTGVQDQAAQAEARAEAAVAVAREASQTQYAGTGLVVNIENISAMDPNSAAAAFLDAAGWLARTQIPA